MRPGLFVVATCVLAAGIAAARGFAEDAPRPVPGKAPEGLALVVEAATRTLAPGAPVRLTANLVNRSKERKIPIVLPGDGSDSGWREPSMTWTVARVGADGAETSVPPRGYLRCGNHDAVWTDEVRTLAPGEKADVTTGPAPFDLTYDLQDAGTYRIRATYTYECGRAAPGAARDAVPDTGLMGTTPAFRIVSDPAEIEIVRPFEIELRAKSSPKAGRTVRPEDFLEAVVVAPDGKTVTIDSGAWELQWVPEPGGVIPDGWDETKLAAAPAAVRTGARVALTGPSAAVTRASYPWKFAEKGTFRVTVRLVEAREGGARIRSAPVAVRIE